MDATDRQIMEARLKDKLKPWRIRTTLGFAGLYQLAHELIKDVVIPRVRSFYLVGFDETGWKCDKASYKAQVLDRDPNKFRASLLWLVEAGAIT